MVNADIYGYVFHFNPYSELWYAIPRDSYSNYWNGVEDESVLVSKEVSVLVELVSKGQDFLRTVTENSAQQ